MSELISATQARTNYNNKVEYAKYWISMSIEAVSFFNEEIQISFCEDAPESEYNCKIVLDEAAAKVIVSWLKFHAYEVSYKLQYVNKFLHRDISDSYHVVIFTIKW